MGKTKTPKKEESSSDSSDSEIEVKTKKQTPAADSSSDSSDSEVETKKKTKKTPVKKTPAKKDDSSSDSSDSEAETKKKSKKTPAKKTPAKKDDSSSDSSDSEAETKKKTKKTPAKKADSSSSDSSDSEDDNKKAAKKTKKASSSSSSSDDDDVEMKETEKVEEKMEAAVIPARSNGAAPASDEQLEVFVGRLSYDATEEDIKELFSTCGEVANVKLLYYPEGNSKGGGFVKMATVEGRNKALELDGAEHMTRYIRVNPASEKPAAKNSGRKRDRPSGCTTIFVGNLPFTVTEDMVRDFFGVCGEISQVRISYHEDGAAKGFGHVEFADGSSTDAAVNMAGQSLGGRPVRVAFSEHRNIVGGDGGFGGRGGRGGGFRGGRGGGRGGRGGGFRGGRGAPNPGASRRNGAIASFDEGNSKRIKF